MGNVLTKQDPRGKVWTYEYDAKGQMTSITDPLSNTTRFYYDGAGNKIKEVDADNREKTYEYDIRDNLIKTVDFDGSVSLFVYNLDGKLLKQTDPEGKEIKYQYDVEGRLTRTIDGNGNTIRMEYDEIYSGCSSCSGGGGGGNPSKTIFPTFSREYRYDKRGRKTMEMDVLTGATYVTEFEYDPAGNLISKTDKEDRITLYGYDQLRRLMRVTDPSGHATGYAYDNRNNLIELKDANQNITRFEYDRNNRLTKEIRPMGEEISYSYDEACNLIQKIDAKGQKTGYEYDDAGRLTYIRYYAVSTDTVPVKTVIFTYNKAGSLMTYDDGTTSASYVYDDLQRKVSETVDYGLFELDYSYEYFKNGTKKSLTGPDGITYSYTYDPNNQLTSVNIPDTGSITINAYEWNRPAAMTLPGGSTKQFVYDPLMRVKSITSKDPGQNQLMAYNYDYSPADNITSKQTEHGDYAYDYDELYRLTTVDNPEFDDEAFTYDSVGNRMTAEGVTGFWDYNLNNELESYSDVSYGYDDNGNLIQKTVDGAVTNFIYNIEDRLTEVRDGSNNLIASYYYDPFGRRLWKEVGGVRTCFLYVDEGLIGEYDASGAEIKTYGYKPSSTWTTDPLFMKQNGEYYFYHNDHLGTPQKMTRGNGEVVWSSKYSSFGEANINAGLTVTNNLRFPGQYYDYETGLHYNYHRYYEPETGRYLRVDPIGIFKGDKAMYVYADDNPFKNIDPKGLVCGSKGNDWFVPDSPFGYDFSECCRNHDDCYAGKNNQCYKPKQTCDNEFCICVAQKCYEKWGCKNRPNSRNPFWPSPTEVGYSQCLGTSYIYCDAVSNTKKAQKAFERAREENCGCNR